MKLDVDQKILGAIPEELSNQVLDLISPEHWYINETRNKMANLEQTQSIILRYFDDYKNAGKSDYLNYVEDKEIYQVFKNPINKIKDELRKYYDFKNYLCFIAKLLPKQTVGMHIDRGSFLDQCHRVHIPIKTNSQVYYIIENSRYSWEKNKIYEFDNTRMHGVENNSDEDRIHLLFNLY
jgi:hypothetical protein